MIVRNCKLSLSLSSLFLALWTLCLVVLSKTIPLTVVLTVLRIADTGEPTAKPTVHTSRRRAIFKFDREHFPFRRFQAFSTRHKRLTILTFTEQFKGLSLRGGMLTTMDKKPEALEKRKRTRGKWLNCRTNTLHGYWKEIAENALCARDPRTPDFSEPGQLIFQTRVRPSVIVRLAKIRQPASCERRPTDYSRLSFPGISGRSERTTIQQGTEKDRQTERERGKERRTRGTERQTERRDIHIRVERGETLIPSCVSLRLNYVTKFQQSVEGRAKLWSGTRLGNDDY